MKRKVAVRKQGKKLSKEEDDKSEESAEEDNSAEDVKPKKAKQGPKVKPKVVVKKTIMKGKSKKAGKVATKTKLKKKSESDEDDGEEEEEDGDDSSEDEPLIKVKESIKRKKKVAKVPVKAKKKKQESSSSEEEETSDEDEEVPIAQLKEKLAEEKKSKLEAVASPLTKNLMLKLKQIDLEQPDKAKFMKKVETKKISNKKSAAATEKKSVRPMPDDAGLIKRTAAEMLAKAGFLKKAEPLVFDNLESDEDNDSKDVKKEEVKPMPKPKPRKQEQKSISIVALESVENEVERVHGLPGYSPLKTGESTVTEAPVVPLKDLTSGKSESVIKTISKKDKPVKVGKLVETEKSVSTKDSLGKSKQTPSKHGKKVSPDKMRKDAGSLKKGSPEFVKKKIVGEDGVVRKVLVKKKKRVEGVTADGRDSKKVLVKPISKPGSKEEGVKVDGRDSKKVPVKPEISKHPSDSKKDSGKNVEDLLKRHVIIKKKSHQPFGKKNAVTVKTAVKTPEKLVKTPDEEKKKKTDGEKRRSSEGGKGERRRSLEKRKRRRSSGSKKVEEEEDEPPPLIDPTKPFKRKHVKKEEPKVVDMTMMDLFQPDNLLAGDEAKGEESKPSSQDGHGKKEQGGRRSDLIDDVERSVRQIMGEGDLPDLEQELGDVSDSPSKWHPVLSEHQYSKPSSPTDSHGGLVVSRSSELREDIESVSHTPRDSVVMDSLPDQFMEEVEEVSSTSASLPAGKEVTPKIRERPSILETLDTELMESGSDFVIVGQVEIGRLPAGLSLPSSTSQRPPSLSPKQKEIVTTPSKEAPEISKIGRSHQLVKEVKKRRKSSGGESQKSDKKTSKHQEKRKDSKSKTKKDEDVDARGKDTSGDKDVDKFETESEDEEVDDHEDDDDYEPNDPDMLYCICQKPYNNRFMLCCDGCEEWFHGSCVGVTRAKGKEMEEREEDWICPKCLRKSKDEDKGVLSPTSTTHISASDFYKNSSSGAAKSKPVTQSPRCIGKRCDKPPRSGWVYCSNECIMTHAQDSLKSIRDDQMRQKMVERGKSSVSSKGWSSSDPVEVIDKRTGKVLTGSHAPMQRELQRWLERHPSYEVHREKYRSSRDGKREVEKERKSDKDRDRHSHNHGDRHSHHHDDKHSRRDSLGGKDSGKKVEERSKGKVSTLSRPDRKEVNVDQVRKNVQVALGDSLMVRAHDADDIKLTDTDIKSLALVIEKELFSLFNDAGHKYRTKYRSLLFNIKDQKNKGLFRKILTGKIQPDSLVQMTSEELASRDLAKWREQESKHQLEMIQQVEKEAAKESSRPVRKKTHKGEVEVDEEDLSTLTTRLEEAKDPEPETAQSVQQVQVALVDTTAQHKAHLFDPYCKVCTGKIVPGDLALYTTADHSIDSSTSDIDKSAVSEAEKKEMEEFEAKKEADLAKAEEVMKETLSKMKKTKEEMSNLRPASPIAEYSPPLSPTDTEDTKSDHLPSSSSTNKKVVVRSPDSALQSGLESKSKFTPTEPMLWSGSVSMQDVSKFSTSAYIVSGPSEHITLPDSIQIMGRISPDHMWDYLSKIRQSGSKDLSVIRFVPGSGDEKESYVQLYSYLNSRGRCGVADNPNKKVKDFYMVPLASHSKIPRTILPFDGPGLEENRQHMLIGILVRAKAKDGSEDVSKSTSGSESRRSSSSSRHSSSSKSSKHSGSSLARDPRVSLLGKTKEPSPKGSPSSSGSSSKLTSEPEEAYQPEYVPSAKAKAMSTPVAEYIPTPTALLKGLPSKKDKSKSLPDSPKHQSKRKESDNDEMENTPYSPTAEEPYDPGDDGRLTREDGKVKPSDSSRSSESSKLPSKPERKLTDDIVASEEKKTLSNSTTKTEIKPSPVSSSETESSLIDQIAQSSQPSEISALMVKVLAKAGATTPQEQQTKLLQISKQVEERKQQLKEEAKRKEVGSNQQTESSPPEVLAEKSGSSSTHNHTGTTSSTSQASLSDRTDKESSIPPTLTPFFFGENVVSSSNDTKSSSSKTSVNSDVPLLPRSLDDSTVSPTSELAIMSQGPAVYDPANPVDKPSGSPPPTVPTDSADVGVGKKSGLPQLSEIGSLTPLLSSIRSAQTTKPSTSVGLSSLTSSLTTDTKDNSSDKFSFHKTEGNSLNSKSVDVFSGVEAKSSKVADIFSALKSSASKENASGDSKSSTVGANSLGVDSSKPAGMPDAISSLFASFSGKTKQSTDNSTTDSASSRDTSVSHAKPSIEELLNKLKTGGFQFSVKQDSTSESTTLTHTTVAQSTPSISMETSSSTISQSSSSKLSPLSTLSSTLAHKPSTSMDVDSRSQGTTSSKTDPSPTNFSSNSQVDRAPPLPTPKNPLDPRAFPPLPGAEPPSLPSAPRPTTFGPLHPRLPLPPHVDLDPPAYDPTPKSRLADDSPVYDSPVDTDVDMRGGASNKSLPPLPPQPPPPLPPLPLPSVVPAQPPSKTPPDQSDVDYRSRSHELSRKDYHKSDNQDRDHRRSETSDHHRSDDLDKDFRRKDDFDKNYRRRDDVEKDHRRKDDKEYRKSDDRDRDRRRSHDSEKDHHKSDERDRDQRDRDERDRGHRRSHDRDRDFYRSDDWDRDHRRSQDQEKDYHRSDDRDHRRKDDRDYHRSDDRDYRKSKDRRSDHDRSHRR